MNITGIIFLIAAILVAVWGKLKGEQKSVNDKKIPETVTRWKDKAEKYSRQFNVPVKYILATIWQESAGKPGAVGSANEKGLMQLKPIAVRDVESNFPGESFGGWDNLPEQNIKAGTAFLAVQKRRTGNWYDAMKAYNQGYQGMKVYPKRANEYAAGVENKAQFFA